MRANVEGYSVRDLLEELEQTLLKKVIDIMEEEKERLRHIPLKDRRHFRGKQSDRGCGKAGLIA